VGNDALLPTQNTISRVGKFEIRGGGGKVKKTFLPILFKNRAGAHAYNNLLDSLRYIYGII